MIDTDRLRRPLLLLLVAAGLVFGLGPVLVPVQFAQAVGLSGDDVFVYRLAGAATLGYGVALLLGYRDAWASIRILIAATAVFNACSLAACLLIIARGGAVPVVYIIALASTLFTIGTLALLVSPPSVHGEATRPMSIGRGPDVQPWFVGLLAIGTLSALGFGVAALLLDGELGRILGYRGTDELIYRQAGAATLGQGIGGLLALRSRRWSELRLAIVGAFVFNVVSVVAAVVELAGGGRPIAWVILGAAALVALGTFLALARGSALARGDVIR